MSPLGISSRRSFLQAGIAGVMASAFSPWSRRLSADASLDTAKSCILVWLNGGPSHLDTFDPKPGTDTGGPIEAIETKNPALKLSHYFPQLAQRADLFSIIRSLTSEEADHDRAYHYLHTGNRPQPVLEYPSLGAVATRRWSVADSDMPPFVTLGTTQRGGSAGFLGVDYAPLLVNDLGNPLQNLSPPESVEADRQARRLEALAGFNRGFSTRLEQPLAADHIRVTEKALRMMSGRIQAAFDLSQEPAEILEFYAAAAEDATFQRSCVVARRLLEHGARFVEIVLEGWDTHGDNFAQVEALSGQLDPGLAGLLGDLAQRGMLEETLVICMGEFGRTPTINAQTGRDHWSDAFGALVAGGRIQPGRVIGATDPAGGTVQDRPVTIPEFYDTLLTSCGVDGHIQLRSPDGRPIRLVDKTTPVGELL